MGAGETAVTVAAAAIGNAIFDATGARLRQASAEIAADAASSKNRNAHRLGNDTRVFGQLVCVRASVRPFPARPRSAPGGARVDDSSARVG